MAGPLKIGKTGIQTRELRTDLTKNVQEIEETIR